MRVIAFTRRDGGLSVVRPVEGARLAVAVIDANGTDVARVQVPQPVDRFFRRWPADGLTAEWAETEDEFVGRIAAKDVPVNIIDPPAGVPGVLPRAEAVRLGLSCTDTPFQIVDEASLPADRSMRAAWVQDAKGGVVLCPVKTEALRKAAVAAQLADSDKWMSRGSEDTAVKLLEKGLMTREDYDPVFIQRINIRRGLRGKPLI